MIKHKQLFKHDPDNGVYGDCDRTVVACLLNRERPELVPHWCEMGWTDEAHAERRAWLRRMGYVETQTLYNGSVELGDVLESQGHFNPGVYFMLTGTSRTGCNHVVIGCGREIVHDPSLTDAGIIGPCDDGYWRVSWLMPILFTDTSKLRR